LLQLFGIPYLVAPTEAEAQCAELTRLALVDGVITDDSDIFLFGGTPVFKNVFQQQRHVECFSTRDIERELSLTRDRLVQLALLLGSDYTDGVPGIGRVTAMEVIGEWSDPDGLCEFARWTALDTSFPDRYVVDAYMHPVVDDSPDAFCWELPDLDGIRYYMLRKLFWPKEKVDE
ncbi:XPG I-region-domain-containing protein, partial [Thamnocephalis sphaerospora]